MMDIFCINRFIDIKVERKITRKSGKTSLPNIYSNSYFGASLINQQ